MFKKLSYLASVSILATLAVTQAGQAMAAMPAFAMVAEEGTQISSRNVTVIPKIQALENPKWSSTIKLFHTASKEMIEIHESRNIAPGIYTIQALYGHPLCASRLHCLENCQFEAGEKYTISLISNDSTLGSRSELIVEKVF